MFVRLSAVLAYEAKLAEAPPPGHASEAKPTEAAPSPPHRRPGKPDVLAPDWWRHPDG